MYFVVYTHTKKVVYKSEYTQYIIRDYVKIEKLINAISIL